MIFIECISFLTFTINGVSSLPESGTHGHYSVLTCKVDSTPPFNTVDFVYGPHEIVNGNTAIWWQIEARMNENDEMPLFTLRALTSDDPLIAKNETFGFHRYILSIPPKCEVFEYCNIHTKLALTPSWKNFELYFIPHIAFGSYTQNSLPETLEYLGHVLTLNYADHNTSWESWD